MANYPKKDDWETAPKKETPKAWAAWTASWKTRAHPRRVQALSAAILLMLLILIGMPSHGASNAQLPVNAGEKEAILQFYSETRVRPETSSIVVTETINFVSDGQAIKHGLVRGLKKFERSSDNAQTPISYTIISATDGKTAIPFDLKDEQGIMKIYLGNPQVPLTPGAHEFTVQYEVTGKIKVDGNFERLSWDVTGSWPVPVRQVNAVVFLPELVVPNEKSTAVEARIKEEFENWWGGADLRSTMLRAAIRTHDSERNSNNELKPIGFLVAEASKSIQLSPGQSIIGSVKWPKGFVFKDPSGTGTSFKGDV